MLPPCPAETGKRILRDIIAPLHGNLLDGIGHVFNGNGEKTIGHLLSGTMIPGGFCDLAGKTLELRGDALFIKRLIGVRAENMRKKFRQNLAGQQIAIGNGEYDSLLTGGFVMLIGAACIIVAIFPKLFGTKQ